MSTGRFAERWRRRLDRPLTIGLPVGFFLVFTLFPIYWLVNSSLKSSSNNICIRGLGPNSHH